MGHSLSEPFLITSLVSMLFVLPSAWISLGPRSDSNARKFFLIAIFFVSSFIVTYAIFQFYWFKFERIASLIPFDVKNEAHGNIQNKLYWLFSIPLIIGLLHMSCAFFVTLKRENFFSLKED